MKKAYFEIDLGFLIEVGAGSGFSFLKVGSGSTPPWTGSAVNTVSELVRYKVGEGVGGCEGHGAPGHLARLQALTKMDLMELL